MHTVQYICHYVLWRAFLCVFLLYSTYTVFGRAEQVSKILLTYLLTALTYLLYFTYLLTVITYVLLYLGARGKHPPARYDREHPLQHQPGHAGAGGQGGPGHHRQGGRDRGGHQEAGDQPKEDRGRDCRGGDDHPQAQGRHLGEGRTQ